MSDDILEQYLSQVNAIGENPQSCKSCRFYFEQAGFCRRRAPTVDAVEWAVWPVTSATDWCGEWEASE